MRLADLQARLETDGLLMLSDAKLPSVVGLVIGGPVKGSWWSHPKGREIYALLEELVDHGDVLSVKLVDEKVTFVHRRLWPAVIAVARAREPWQTNGLSKPARALLTRVDAEGELEAHGAAVKELEIRLLAHSGQIHTSSGAHATVLTTWPRWSKRHGPIGRAVAVSRAKQELRAIVDRLNEANHAKAGLRF